MMSFTQDGQLDEHLLQERDKLYNSSTEHIRWAAAQYKYHTSTMVHRITPWHAALRCPHGRICFACGAVVVAVADLLVHVIASDWCGCLCQPRFFMPQRCSKSNQERVSCA